MRTLIATLCCLFFISTEAKSVVKRQSDQALDSIRNDAEKIQRDLMNPQERSLIKSDAEKIAQDAMKIQKQIKRYEVPALADMEGIDDGIAVAADPSIDPGIVYLRNPDGTPAKKSVGNTDEYFDNGLWNGLYNSGSVWGENIIDSALKALPQQEMTIPDDSALRAIPEIHIPKIVIPRINVPSVTIPEITVPEITIPQITVPEMKIPAQHIEGITIPEIHVPGINIPEKHIKGLKIPKRHIKGFTIPEQTIPERDRNK